MRSIRAIVADVSPAMRRWQAAALARLSRHVDECENGWDVLERLWQQGPPDLVLVSKWLPGVSGAQILALLQRAGAELPFVLVAPFCDAALRALVDSSPFVALVEDPLDGVEMARAAETVLAAAAEAEAAKAADAATAADAAGTADLAAEAAPLAPPPHRGSPPDVVSLTRKPNRRSSPGLASVPG